MSTEQKFKVCMLGNFGVGKTSLVSRLVRNTFSDKYLTTVGVKVDTKPLQIDGQAITLVLWDIEGADNLSKLQRTYLRGCHGLFLVADGLRPSTLDVALDLSLELRAAEPDMPAVLAINKLDLLDQWKVTTDQIRIASEKTRVYRTSALDATDVEAAFIDLASQMQQQKALTS